MQKLTVLSSEDFLTLLASAEPAPGGGAGAAMAGALAASLASMVANLTIGKGKFAAQESEVKALLGQAEAVRAELLALAQEDAAVFDGFINCYKLPKNTEAEKALRTEAIRREAKQAAEVPLAIARASLQALRLAERFVIIGNPNVISDSACSGLLARAALRCAEYNVRINLHSTKDAAYNERMLRELAAMLQEAQVVEQHILRVTDTVLAQNA